MSKTMFQITIDDLIEAKNLVDPDVRLNFDQWDDLEQFLRIRLENEVPEILEATVIDFLDEEVLS